MLCCCLLRNLSICCLLCNCAAASSTSAAACAASSATLASAASSATLASAKTIILILFSPLIYSFKQWLRRYVQLLYYYIKHRARGPQL